MVIFISKYKRTIMKLRLSETKLKNIIKEVLSEWYEADVNYDEGWIDNANYDPEYDDRDPNDYIADEEDDNPYAYEILCDKYGEVYPIIEDPYHECGFIVKNGNKWNVADNNGKLLTKQWYDQVGLKYPLPVDRDNTICADDVYTCELSSIPVKLNGKWNLLHFFYHSLISKVWFDSIEKNDDDNGYTVKIVVDGQTYCIDQRGWLYSKKGHFIKKGF